MEGTREELGDAGGSDVDGPLLVCEGPKIIFKC